MKFRKLKKRFKLGENEKIVLLAIGAGTFLIASLAFPNLPMALQPILKMRGNKGFLKLLKKLRDKNIIILGGERIKLTQKGRKLLKEIQIDQIEIPKQKDWDEVWHLVSYDIPDTHKKERDWFRQTLERLGFYQIQESLWVYPFDCKEEIAVIAKTMNIAPFVIVMNTNHLPNQKDMEEYFDL
jgi:hypothetical protein